MSNMTNFYRKDLRLKILKETGLWSDIDANLVNNLRKDENNDFFNFNKNHHYFTEKCSGSAIKILIFFLTSTSK